MPGPPGFNGTARCDIGATEVPDDAIYFDSLATLSPKKNGVRFTY